MPRKKLPEKGVRRERDPHVMGLRKEVLEQPITETLEINYMPYAMSVIISRAIPEIDGFKPSHRKLLYTMYTMKLLSGSRTKSANIVGQTMKLNPHGDAAIYDTMVRLSRGYGALLHPFVDSKGNFGKVYSRDMAWAASRYTEAKLDAICAELFRDIEQGTVDFVPNYDGSILEPTLLPTTFPNILVSANQGIAVSMASNLCGFNLREVCEAEIAFLKNPGCDLLSILKAPDFPTGGALLYDAAALGEVYSTGRGSFQVRAKWRYVKASNMIEIYEIPYTTTAEAILDKITDLVKTGKVREISDMRDETDLNGLKLTIDLKRGADPDKLMARLFKSTSLQDSFPCNFNILISGMPRVMGVRDILEAWTTWRCEGIRRRTEFRQKRQKEKLHLLQGLQKILLDIDRAVQVIRDTKQDAEVVPNLMIGFGMDQIQAEYVADIRLKNLNQEYILKRVAEIASLEEEIQSLQDILDDSKKVKKLIIGELRDVMKKYPSPRRTEIVYQYQTLSEADFTPDIPDYPVHLFLSQKGYLKKITSASLRMNSEQKYKEGDQGYLRWEASNRDELLVFTDRQQCWKTRLSEFDDAKASVLGDYLPTKLGMDAGENVVWACVTSDYAGALLFFFENGKAARVELSSYQTQTRRKKLTGAFSDKSPLAAVCYIRENVEIALISTDKRCLVFHTSVLAPRTTRNHQGVQVMELKARHHLEKAVPLSEAAIQDVDRYRAHTLPAVGALLKRADRGEKQLSLLDEGN